MTEQTENYMVAWHKAEREAIIAEFFFGNLWQNKHDAEPLDDEIMPDGEPSETEEFPICWPE